MYNVYLLICITLPHTHTHTHTPIFHSPFTLSCPLPSFVSPALSLSLSMIIQKEPTETTDGGDDPSPLTSDPSTAPPTSTLTQQPKSPTKPHPQAHTPTPPPVPYHPSVSPTVAESSDELISLRQALQSAEEQTQLINDEYRKLFKEKEVLHVNTESMCTCTTDMLRSCTKLMYMYMYMYVIRRIIIL